MISWELVGKECTFPIVLGGECSSWGVMESGVVGPWACRKQGSAPREEPACEGENLPHYTPIEKKIYFYILAFIFQHPK